MRWERKVKVYVTRTSIYNLQPCEGATQVTVRNWDQRTFKSFEEHDARFPHQPWQSFGDEHGVNEIGIYRRLPSSSQYWVVEISSLEYFIRQHGRVVIDSVSELELREDPSTKLEIEIYDDYRE